MGQATPKTVVIRTDREDASELQEQIMAEVQALDYPENACFAIRLALEEGLANAIRHGNKSDPTKKIQVSYDVTPEQVTVTICDEGPGFVPNDLPDPTLDENIDKPCGRGVMLINAYMTDVSYNDQGNCVTMIKRRDCPLPVI